MTKTVLVQLNDRWRVVDDPLQWILQCRFQCRDGTVQWNAKSFPTTRKVLLRAIHERGIEADPEAIAYIETWPEKHRAYGDRLSVSPIKRVMRGHLTTEATQTPQAAEIGLNTS